MYPKNNEQRKMDNQLFGLGWVGKVFSSGQVDRDGWKKILGELLILVLIWMIITECPL